MNHLPAGVVAVPAPTEPAPLDTRRRFVRLRRERANGLVEFDFAIGEPELFVELILGRAAFDEFCANQRVEMLPPPAGDAAAEAEASDWEWRLADATGIRFK